MGEKGIGKGKFSTVSEMHNGSSNELSFSTVSLNVNKMGNDRVEDIINNISVECEFLVMQLQEAENVSNGSMGDWEILGEGGLKFAIKRRNMILVSGNFQEVWVGQRLIAMI